MAHNRRLFVIIILFFTVSMLSALELNGMIGLNLYHFNFPAPQIQMNVSSTPVKGLVQPELGLSYALFIGLWSEVEAVLRLWFLFPESNNIAIREKLRIGLEVSPIVVVLFCNATLWFPGFKPAVCGSFTVSRPERKVSRDVFASLGVMLTPEKSIDGTNIANVYAYLGFMWRWKTPKA